MTFNAFGLARAEVTAVFTFSPCCVVISSASLEGWAGVSWFTMHLNRKNFIENHYLRGSEAEAVAERKRVQQQQQQQAQLPGEQRMAMPRSLACCFMQTVTGYQGSLRLAADLTHNFLLLVSCAGAPDSLHPYGLQALCFMRSTLRACLLIGYIGCFKDTGEKRAMIKLKGPTATSDSLPLYNGMDLNKCAIMATQEGGACS